MVPPDSDWTIVFYLDESESSPVADFLNGLDRKTRVRFVWSIEQLRLRNVQAREPLVRHLSDKLWELRQESGKNIYRVVYVFAAGKLIVLIHGFQKKTQRTPRGELAVAQARFNDFVSRSARGET